MNVANAIKPTALKNHRSSSSRSGCNLVHSVRCKFVPHEKSAINNMRNANIMEHSTKLRERKRKKRAGAGGSRNTLRGSYGNLVHCIAKKKAQKVISNCTIKFRRYNYVMMLQLLKQNKNVYSRRSNETVRFESFLKRCTRKR